MSVLMFTADLNSVRDKCILDKATLFLPKYRRAKIRNYRFQKDRRLSVLTWVLLRYSLSAFGCTDFEDKIGFSKYGKPFLVESKDIYFNLSHSNTVAFCAVSNTEIGCDVECPSSIDWEEISRAFFYQSEYNYLINTGGEEGFFKIWTLKESFTKLIGRGLYIPLNSFEIKVESEMIYVNYPFDERIYHFYYTKLNGYHYACSSLSAFDDKAFIQEVDVCDLVDLKN